MVGGMHGGGGGHVWQGGAWWVVCMVGGMHGRGRGGCAWQGGGMYGGGEHVWQGGIYGRGHMWWGAYVAGKTAIAAGGTHPTGMHSCFHAVFNKVLPNYRSSPPLGLAPPGNPGSAAGELIVLASGGGTTQKLVMNTN